jgi:hypothetical protein
MEQQIEQEKVTYLMHESDMARADLKNKRLWITLNGVLAGIAVVTVIGVINRCLNRTS